MVYVNEVLADLAVLPFEAESADLAPDAVSPETILSGTTITFVRVDLDATHRSLVVLAFIGQGLRMDVDARKPLSAPWEMICSASALATQSVSWLPESGVRRLWNA